MASQNSRRLISSTSHGRDRSLRVGSHHSHLDRTRRLAGRQAADLACIRVAVTWVRCSSPAPFSRQAETTPARVTRASRVVIARSSQVFILSRAGGCPHAPALVSHAGEGYTCPPASGSQFSKRTFATGYDRPGTVLQSVFRLRSSLDHVGALMSHRIDVGSHNRHTVRRTRATQSKSHAMIGQRIT